MSAIKVVSCDVHGTLVLPHPSVGEIYAMYARSYGYFVEAERLESTFVSAFKQVRSRSQLAYGANQDDARVFWIAVIKACFSLAHDIEPSEQCCLAIFHGFGEGAHWLVLDNIHAVLQQVKKIGVPLVICSNFDQRVRGILSDLDLDHYIDDWFISAELGMAKPDPRLMHAVAKQFSCDCSEILHIGNHLREDGQLCADSGAHFMHVDQRQNKPMRLEDFQLQWSTLNPS